MPCAFRAQNATSLAVLRSTVGLAMVLHTGLRWLRWDRGRRTCFRRFAAMSPICAGALPLPRRCLARLGNQIAWATTLRNMSLSIASKLNAGEDPLLESAIVKDLGCQFEQGLPGLAQELCALEPTLEGDGSDYQQVLGSLMQVAPSFSLRGGTPEIMRGIIAKGMGIR